MASRTSSDSSINTEVMRIVGWLFASAPQCRKLVARAIPELNRPIGTLWEADQITIAMPVSS